MTNGNSDIIRQLTIDLVTDSSNPIIESFDVLWEKLLVVECDVFHDVGGEYIYYTNKGGVKHAVFFLDTNTSNLLCDSDYWLKLEYQFMISHNRVSHVIELLVKSKLDNISIPLNAYKCIHGRVEIVLKNL